MAARRNRKGRRRNRGRFGFLYKLLSTLAICAVVVAALTLFFRVDTIEVSGTARYPLRRSSTPPASAPATTSFC